MILTKTPVRVPLAGGGTDLPFSQKTYRRSNSDGHQSVYLHLYL